MKTLERKQIDRDVLEKFHDQWYHSIDWRNDLKWRGIPILKNPLDLFIYQEIISESKPDCIIEIGCAYGGFGAFLHDILPFRLIDYRTVGVDNRSNDYVPKDYNISKYYDFFVEGDSTNLSIVEVIKNFLTNTERNRVMVILDSDHQMKHVMSELALYSQLVSVEQYLIVEDINTDLVLPNFGPGPDEALSVFLARGGIYNFEVDETREKFGVTFNHWLKRIK